MTDRIQFDSRDKAALRALDSDFAIDASGEIATIAGDMKVEVVRVADDKLQLTIQFPAGEGFAVLLSRAKTLEQLNVKADESLS